MIETTQSITKKTADRTEVNDDDIDEFFGE